MYFIVGKTINQNKQVTSYLITDGEGIREVTPQQVYLEYQRGTLPYINGFNVTTGELDFKNIDNSLLPTFYNNRGLSNTVSVLKILTDNDSQIGVRVLVASGKIMNVRLSDIIKLVNSKEIQLFNAKIVNNKVVMKYAGSIVTESNRGNKEEVTINNHDKSKFIIAETLHPKDNLRLMKYNGNAKEVIIPRGVTSIDSNVFYGCTELVSITIPSSVMCICDRAFRGCTGLKSITIPDGVKYIDRYVFSKCTSLTSIVIPDSVTSIDDGAFSDCTGLTSITIPNNVTSIGNYAFRGCTGLTSITIPNSVTSIGSSVFDHCTGLTSIKMPNGVTSIGDYAFCGCTGLTSIKMPNGVTSIGDYAFCGCTGLTSITIPKSVTSVGVMAFNGCTGLTSITISKSVTDIGYCAFDCCPNLFMTIKGVRDSAIKRYAMEHNIEFETIT